MEALFTELTRDAVALADQAGDLIAEGRVGEPPSDFRARGDRTVLVITGKGLKKVNGDPRTIIERGVLRTMLPIWLNSPELSQLVAGWDQSAQGHGGAGAWYVRLKRQPQ